MLLCDEQKNLCSQCMLPDFAGIIAKANAHTCVGRGELGLEGIGNTCVEET